MLRRDSPALREPPRYESRGEIHPGAMDAPKDKAKEAAAARWREIRAALEAQIKSK